MKTLIYFMVYGHVPYEDIDLENQDPEELERRFQAMAFPELSRHEPFDDLISACWYNVYPTMALLAYDCKCKTKDIASEAEYRPIDTAKVRKACEALIQRGLLGPDLALRFQSAWRRYLHFIWGKGVLIWQSLLRGRKVWFW